MSPAITMPGTLTKVTPEMLAPIMPNATRYHADLPFARKKVSLSALWPVVLLINSKMQKYARIVPMIIIAAAKLRKISVFRAFRKSYFVILQYVPTSGEIHLFYKGELSIL